MSGEKIIAAVGVSDEETAHLRLLIRKSAGQLEHAWRWGSEEHADLLVVDPGSFAGQMTLTRAQVTGVRCAVFAIEPPEGAALVLKRPLLGANVVEVLNAAGLVRTPEAQIMPHTADFYTRDIGDDHSAVSAGEASAEPPVDGLDELLRHEPIELRGDSVTRTGPAPTIGGRTEENPTPAREVPAKQYATRAAMLADTMPRTLRAYLEGDLLGGPARIVLADIPPLALDPKLKVYHSAASLAVLRAYAQASWRLCDWQPLTTFELAELRVSQPAQPWSRLIWLDTLVHSDGHLAAHLDPGGTYRLKQWIPVDRELGSCFRIASSMLQPVRLHEIAAASGASMAEVFDVVNAYDAIGLIEMQRRQRRDEGPAEKSLLGKWRKPFGTS